MIDMKFLSKLDPISYLLLRLVFGFLFACHGFAKIFGLFGEHRVAMGLTLSYFGALIELIGGVLIFLGLFTRFAAFISSGEMAVAYFKFHAKGSLFPIANHGELAVIFCFAALVIATRGVGWLGFDRS
jgi:putative oxidoreductase